MRLLLAPLLVLLTLGCSATPDAEATDTAVDPFVQAGDCASPFNCKLPNPDAANANRATDPANGTDAWPIHPGTVLVNGFGGVRGTVSSHSVKLNYGQRKVIGGVAHVYAFGAGLEGGGGASGWIDQRAVIDHVASMRTVSARDPGKGDYETIFTVTGGDLAKYGDLKVDPNFTGSHEAASDYLKREGDVMNLLYNLPGVGGVATDTLPLGTHFHRSLGVLAVYIDLYHPGGSRVVAKMEFVYGHIGTRWGWIAHDALTPN